jgi:hemerythrin-like domain-containing protein
MLFPMIRELEADTRLHIHKENNVLFPMVVQLEGGASMVHESTRNATAQGGSRVSV